MIEETYCLWLGDPLASRLVVALRYVFKRGLGGLSVIIIRRNVDILLIEVVLLLAVGAVQLAVKAVLFHDVRLVGI